MVQRAPAQTIAPRTGTNSGPVVFGQTTCERELPRDARRVVIGEHQLPLPPRSIRRIVVIGDTGCRIKASDHFFQACNDPDQYPFAQVAAKAAAWHPDIVIHVGDYLYRETACPEGVAGCKDSAFGYGSDSWRADFLDPAAPLLAAAPWVMARGNHESCWRAGQGFRRMLDPAPLDPNTNCNLVANDGLGDYSEPYAVPLGDGVQLIIFDSSNTPAVALDPADPRALKYARMYQSITELASEAKSSIGVDHHPILGFAATLDKEGKVQLHGGNAGLQSVFARLGPLLPDGIELMLSGHIHLWQQVSFATEQPSQLIAGFSGTAEDIVPMPAELPEGVTPYSGATVESFSSWINGFGYMTLERHEGSDWIVRVWNRSGVEVNRCEIHGKHSRCDLSQVVPQT